MAEISYALLAFLMADAAVAAVFEERIAVDRIEDDITYPFAIIKDVVTNPMYSHDGEGNAEYLFQIDVYHDQKVDCDTSASILKTALSGYQGMMDTVKVGKTFVTNSRGEWAADGRHFCRILEVRLGTERN